MAQNCPLCRHFVERSGAGVEPTYRWATPVSPVLKVCHRRSRGSKTRMVPSGEPGWGALRGAEVGTNFGTNSRVSPRGSPSLATGCLVAATLRLSYGFDALARQLRAVVFHRHIRVRLVRVAPVGELLGDGIDGEDKPAASGELVRRPRSDIAASFKPGTLNVCGDEVDALEVWVPADS